MADHLVVFRGCYTFNDIYSADNKDARIKLDQIIPKIQPDEAVNIQFTSVCIFIKNFSHIKFKVVRRVPQVHRKVLPCPILTLLTMRITLEKG